MPAVVTAVDGDASLATVYGERLTLDDLGRFLSAAAYLDLPGDQVVEYNIAGIGRNLTLLTRGPLIVEGTIVDGSEYTEAAA